MVAIAAKQYPQSPNSEDNFEIVGLGALIKMFKIYGLRLDTAPGSVRSKRYNLLLLMYGIFYGFSFIVSVSFFNTLISGNVQNSNMVIISYVVMNVGYQLKILYCFLHPCIYFAKYGKYLGDLATTLRRIHDLDPGQKARTQSLTRLLIAMTVIDICIFAIMNSMVSEEVLSEMPQWLQNQQLNYILGQGIKILSSFVYTILCSFSIFYPLFCMLICKLMAVCFDAFVPYDDTNEILAEHKFNPHPWTLEILIRRITLAKRQKEHRYLCILVKQANTIFSWFLFISAIEEMALVIMLFQQNTELQFPDNVITVKFTKYAFSIWKIGHFIMKAVCFSAVNEKVKSSLMIPSYSENDATYNSKEHIQYLLYLKQQTISPTSITYAGLFPVNLTYIFTLVSTAITYMLVIKDIPK